MSDQYLGEIRMVGFNFAPSGWALCNGALLSIAQNTALFALLGTTFGGDGVQNFGLPDLQGRAPISPGQGAGLPAYVLGQKGGSSNVTLQTSNMPQHTHLAACSNLAATVNNPTGAIWAEATQGTGKSAQPVPAYAAASSPTGTMATNALSTTGGSTPFSVQSPYTVVNFIIALTGIFPPRQ